MGARKGSCLWQSLPGGPPVRASSCPFPGLVPAGPSSRTSKYALLTAYLQGAALGPDVALYVRGLYVRGAALLQENRTSLFSLIMQPEDAAGWVQQLLCLWGAPGLPARFWVPRSGWRENRRQQDLPVQRSLGNDRYRAGSLDPTDPNVVSWHTQLPGRLASQGFLFVSPLSLLRGPWEDIPAVKQCSHERSSSMCPSGKWPLVAISGADS